MKRNEEFRDILDDVLRECPAGRQQENYTVGLTEGRALVISKAGGVTAETAGMDELRDAITRAEWWTTGFIRHVYLAQTFGAGGASNHGEMCVLAACKALRDPLALIECAGQNCSACFAMVEDVTLNEESELPQQGWVHPCAPIAMGTQRPGSWRAQVASLRIYNERGTRDENLLPLTASPRGRCEVFLSH